MSEIIRVLVVDDNEDDRVLYRRTLHKSVLKQYEVVETSNGEEGLVLADPTRVDCVLLDYSLPGRNGVEVLKRMRAKHPFLPVVMLTGQGNESVAVSAMQAGAQNYIVKSGLTGEAFDRAILLAIAHCAMERRIEDQRSSLEIFTRAMAHDLKEPVRTIRSFISVLLAREPLTEDGKRYFGFVLEAAERMAALIDAVYLYTRLDSSARPVLQESCSMDAAMREAQLDLSELIRERRATITAGPLPEVNVAEQHMRQVLQNLVSNAIRHSVHPAVISIDAVEQAEFWLVRVADNGPGVEPAQRQKIFEPFIRQGPNPAQGLGMGLAICKRIIESHGGQIWCEPREGGGSEFHFTLPKPAAAEAIAPAPPTPADKARAAAADDHTLARVLLVDDNEAAIELTRIVLIEGSKLRCQFVSAGGGEEALSLLADAARKNEGFDLVLLDINMPRMDGFEVLQRIRQNTATSKVAVVMCTTSSYDKDLERARDLGATGFVNKPATLKNLGPVLSAIETLRVQEVEGGRLLLRVA